MLQAFFVYQDVISLKKNYHVSLAVISILNDDGSIVFHSSHNDGFLLFLKIKLTIVRVTY